MKHWLYFAVVKLDFGTSIFSCRVWNPYHLLKNINILLNVWRTSAPLDPCIFMKRYSFVFGSHTFSMFTLSDQIRPHSLIIFPAQLLNLESGWDFPTNPQKSSQFFFRTTPLNLGDFLAHRTLKVTGPNRKNTPSITNSHNWKELPISIPTFNFFEKSK